MHCDAEVSDLDVEMSLRNHYLNKESYVVEVANEVSKVLGEKKGRVLTVGCSVGRIALELGRWFEESIGIDYTTRYFQILTKLKESGCLKYKDIAIDMKAMNLDHSNVQFFQMNP